MFAGVAILGLVLVFGIIYGSTLPPGISQRVWIVMYTNSPLSPLIYSGEIGTAGLRGAIIGWNDGVFSEWRTTYFGSWGTK